MYDMGCNYYNYVSCMRKKIRLKEDLVKPMF